MLSLNPAYDDDSLVWDPALVGTWQNSEDGASLEIDRGEWRSYKIRYVYPIEAGELTGYLTEVSNQRFLDIMPVRGEDHGSFLIPVHAVFRVRVEGDRLELSPLSYDWFLDRLRAAKPVAGLNVVTDQKENAVIVSPTPRLRVWLRAQPAAGPVFGPPATFTKVPKEN